MFCGCSNNMSFLYELIEYTNLIVKSSGCAILSVSSQDSDTIKGVEFLSQTLHLEDSCKSSQRYIVPEYELKGQEHIQPTDVALESRLSDTEVAPCLSCAEQKSTDRGLLYYYTRILDGKSLLMNVYYILFQQDMNKLLQQWSPPSVGV